jgi:carbohydrate-binding DOMON domain-containing protein
MSYTITLPVTTTVIEIATTTVERLVTATQVVKEMDTMMLAVVAGITIVLGVAIGIMVGRRWA